MSDDLGRQDPVVVEHLRRSLEGVIAVYRFGSTAAGTASPSSDTDVAVLARHRIPAERRFHVQA